MSRIAVVGNVAVDHIDGQPPSPGGCPSFAAAALRRLGRDGQIVTRFAESDRALFEPLIAGLGVPVTTLAARTTSAFGFRYSGEERAMTVEAIGDPWTPDDAAAVDRTARWVHVAPLVRSDFPPETLAGLAAYGRTVSYDGQGLVRVAQLGPLTLDAAFAPDLLASVTVLKLAEDEALVVAGGRFEGRHAAALGVPEVLVTLGSAGCVLHTADGVVHVPAAWPVHGVQTTGAGDVFMVAYGAARCDGAAAVDAARSASEVVARMLEERKRMR